MKIVMAIGYQQDWELAREVSRAADEGLLVMRYYDPEGVEIGSHPIKPDHVEENLAGFFLEDFKYWFPSPQARPARAVMETPVGRAIFRLDDCGINHFEHPEHVHRVIPCDLLKLSLRYGYDAEVTEPPLVR